MSIQSELREALLPIVPEIEPDVYAGNAEEYMTISITEIPVFFGDGEPRGIRCLITVRWYFPFGMSPTDKKRRIRRAMVEAGTTYPTVTPLDDGVGRCFAFEAEALDGNV